MKKYLVTTFLALGTILIMGAGCQQITNELTDANKPDGTMMAEDGYEDIIIKADEDAMMADETGEIIKGDEEVIIEDNSIIKDDAGAMMDDKQAYTGAVLAGNTAKLYDFNQADYEAALKSGKLVVLYFYASWCPICKAETADALYPAFNELNNDKVVGFRVNFNDNDTDGNEEALAREFGIAYQHTKVFVKDGERALKSPETWDKSRYLSEIAKNL
ncbi:MAG: thioredoxin family protein [bacterium]|nr:thioredoxin family protein [bacterium]